MRINMKDPQTKKQIFENMRDQGIRIKGIRRKKSKIFNNHRDLTFLLFFSINIKQWI
jgi:hypothetical protein